MARQFTPKFESALAAKLRPLAGKLRSKSHTLPALPSVMEIGVDGESHINIWNWSKITLGAAMSQFSPLDFSHPTFKNFASVESYWAWLVSANHDDRLRSLIGRELFALNKTLKKTHVPNLHAMVLHACWLKTKKHHELGKLLKESDLPFDCYYVQRDGARLRIRPPYAIWTVHGWEEIRRAIKENREPDFEFLREVGEKGDDFHAPFIKKLGLSDPPIVETDDQSEEVSEEPNPSVDSTDLEEICLGSEPAEEVA